MIKLPNTLPDKKFIVVGLDTGSSVEDVKAFVKERGIPFLIFRDSDGSTISSPQPDAHR